jgi:Cu-Zn family superoxide dismutase
LVTAAVRAKVDEQVAHLNEENVMNRLRTAGIAAVLALGTGGFMLTTAGSATGDTRLRADLVDANGVSVGKARLTFDDGRSEVDVRIKVSPSMAGFHGFHIHSVGKCEAPFTSAGGHLGDNAADPTHRHRNHAGDLPVLLVDNKGHAEAEFDTSRFNLAEVLDADGAAFIIHAGPDNYANIPATDATTGAARYVNPNAVNPAVYPNTVTDAATLGTGDAGGRAICGVIH